MSTKSEIKISRIKAKDKVKFNLIKNIVSSKELYARTPRLEEVQEARTQHKNLINEIRQWGSVEKVHGSISEKNLAYVAQIDSSIWAAILEVFAKHDPETGELIDDGLLYKADERGNIVLNRDFFYALLDELNDAGYAADMRGRRKIGAI